MLDSDLEPFRSAKDQSGRLDPDPQFQMVRLHIHHFEECRIRRLEYESARIWIIQLSGYT